MTTSSNVKNFFFFPFVFGVALFYTCTFYLLFFLGFSQDDGTPENFMSCHKLGLHTLPRGTLVGWG